MLKGPKFEKRNVFSVVFNIDWDHELALELWRVTRPVKFSEYLKNVVKLVYQAEILYVRSLGTILVFSKSMMKESWLIIYREENWIAAVYKPKGHWEKTKKFLPVLLRMVPLLVAFDELSIMEILEVILV